MWVFFEYVVYELVVDFWWEGFLEYCVEFVGGEFLWSVD